MNDYHYHSESYQKSQDSHKLSCHIKPFIKFACSEWRKPDRSPYSEYKCRQCCHFLYQSVSKSYYYWYYDYNDYNEIYPVHFTENWICESMKQSAVIKMLPAVSSNAPAAPFCHGGWTPRFDWKGFLIWVFYNRKIFYFCNPSGPIVQWIERRFPKP